MRFHKQVTGIPKDEWAEDEEACLRDEEEKPVEEGGGFRHS